MKVFALNGMKASPYEHRENNVFYQTKEFKTRVIGLPRFIGSRGHYAAALGVSAHDYRLSL